MSLRDDLPLAERVNRPHDITQPRRERHRHPKGWEPGVKFDPDTGVPTELISPPMPQIVGDDYSAVLDSITVPIPEGYELRLVEAKFDHAAWHRDAEFIENPQTGEKTKAPAVTRPVWRYRFAVVPSAQLADVDALATLGRLKRTPKARKRFTGEGSFVSPLCDLQAGKVANGKGTPELLERLDRYFDGVLERARDLGKNRLGEFVLPVMGDLVEGCFIYPNQAHQIDLNRRSQMNTATDVLVEWLDRITGEFDRVRVVAVPGNHGEHRVEGKRIDRHDNDDVKVVEDAARVAARDPRMAGVSFMIANEEMALTFDVQGHIFAATHGHVFAKQKGATPDQKAYEWYKNMAAGHHPVGDATVILTAHWHHDIVKNYGSLLLVQMPAVDNGSPEFADYSGTDCPAGMVTFMVTPEKKLTEYEVIR